MNNPQNRGPDTNKKINETPNLIDITIIYCLSL